MRSIEETKQALIAVNALSIYLIKQFKDGVQVQDFLSLYAKLTADEEFKRKMSDAYVGIGEVPAELKDIDVAEIIELTSLQLSFLPSIINSIKE